MAQTFAAAVEVAREHLPIMERIRRPEARCGYVIARYAANDFRVYAADAWEEPTETPLLPWSAPSGQIVAHVNMAGEVEPEEHP